MKSGCLVEEHYLKINFKPKSSIEKFKRKGDVKIVTILTPVEES